MKKVDFLNLFFSGLLTPEKHRKKKLTPEKHRKKKLTPEKHRKKKLTPKKEIDSEEIIIKYLNENESIDNKKARAETGLTADGVKSLFRKWQKSYYKKGIRQKHLLYKKIKYL